MSEGRRRSLYEFGNSDRDSGEATSMKRARFLWKST
jgi:hypothetical protein